MNKLESICNYTLTTIFLFALFTSSCTNVQKTIYFANQKDTILASTNDAPLTLIQSNDILSIAVSSLNPNATAIFNTPNNSYVSGTSATGINLQSPGYLVNTEGNIQYPLLGNIKVTGITTTQLKDMLTTKILEKKLLVDPVVVVRQLNFKVSVLGEVNHPSVLSVPSEKISLLEALGLAGDITVFGKKDNVMVIREENGEKVIKHLNLNSSDIFYSKYYYLKSNDIVYVQANKAKAASATKTVQLLPIILSGLSFIAIILDHILRN